MRPRGAFPRLHGTPGYLQSGKGHDFGSGNLVEKYLSYNKIGNLVSFSSTPQITPSHPPPQGIMSYLSLRSTNSEISRFRLFTHLILKKKIKKSAYSQTEATEGTHQQLSGRPSLGPERPDRRSSDTSRRYPRPHRSRCPQLWAHLMPHSYRKLNSTERTGPGSTIYPVSPSSLQLCKP